MFINVPRIAKSFTITLLKMASPTHPQPVRKCHSLLASVPGRFDIKVSDCLTKADITIPGITFSDTNHLGRVKLSHIARIQDGISSAALMLPDAASGRHVGHLNGMIDERRLFILSGRFDFHESVMDITNYHQPITIKLALQHIGGTSVQYFSNAHLTEKPSTSLFSHSCTIVSVGMKESRPLPVPKETAELKSIVKSNGSPLPRIQHGDRPATIAHIYHGQATWSDIDENGHVNMSHFIRYTLDGATDASRLGKLHCIHGDLMETFISSMEMTYIGEISPRDEYTVHVWESEPNNLPDSLLHCDIEVQGKVVYKITITLKTSAVPTSKM